MKRQLPAFIAATLMPLAAIACDSNNHDQQTDWQHRHRIHTTAAQPQEGLQTSGLQTSSLDQKPGQDQHQHQKNWVPGHYAMEHNQKVWVPAHPADNTHKGA